jgi:CRP/FNR family cyclic AMP-dependent transcriptional regulator
MTRTVKDKVDFEHMLKELGESTQVERGDTVYQPGSPSTSVYIVEEGRVKIAYLDESGKKLTLVILDPGEIFGEMCLVGETQRRHLATAIEDAVIRRVGREDFAEALQQDPLYFQLLLEHFAKRMREFEETLEDLAFRDIQARLSRQLLKLSDEYGVETDEGILIAFQLTHKELADMIGSARENTTLALNRFAREGILDKSRYRIVIKNEEGLREKCHTQN